jgi:hypothetical protein
VSAVINLRVLAPRSYIVNWLAHLQRSCSLSLCNAFVLSSGKVALTYTYFSQDSLQDQPTYQLLIALFFFFCMIWMFSPTILTPSA